MTALPAAINGVSHRDRILNCQTPPPHDWNADGVPDELKQRARWVCWDYEWNGKRLTKVPRHPTGGYKYDVNDPLLWIDFRTAVEVATRNGWGIGFAFNGDVVGLDWDNCRDPETGDLASWAATAVREIGSYTEISPTGTGVKTSLIGGATSICVTSRMRSAS